MVRRPTFFPPIPRSSQPQAPLPPETATIDQGWDISNDTPDSRRLSDNLMDFSSPASPPNGPNFIAQSHISLSPRMSLIPGPAASPQDRLSSLTATVTELTKWFNKAWLNKNNSWLLAITRTPINY
ncbi:hypothetical protein RhiirA5_443449 [Rhizophagus irregularis]|uniref:Uncharacterized protein n=1 Tax=Rhizophagus irregularis TaxID=588596 RepID=A0A2N0NDY1_9GLOM|nr:hypothetical protein RhiirA5_443449 [Rhizophagus irregularis]